VSRDFLAAVLRARVARQHRRSGIGRLIPELGMDQPLAQRVDDRRNGSQRLEGKNLHHEDVGRLLRIAGMGADKVFDLPPAPARIDIVLRQQDDQQAAPLDLGQQVAVELVARLERVIDEDAFAEDVRAFIEVGRQSGDPADRAGGAEGDAVVGMSVADEDVERFISGHRYLDWLRVVGEPSAGSAAARHAGAGQRARTPSRDSRYERSHCRDDPLSGDRRLASRLQAGEPPLRRHLRPGWATMRNRSSDIIYTISIHDARRALSAACRVGSSRSGGRRWTRLAAGGDSRCARDDGEKPFDAGPWRCYSERRSACLYPNKVEHSNWARSFMSVT
jgi:hypothetical protein